MSDGELLPCPFCGGEAKYDNNEGYHYIICDECGARNFGFTREQAFDEWNTRIDVAETDECCEKSCDEPQKDLPIWYCSKWNHQYNFSNCRIAISQSIYWDFVVRRANNDLNTDEWEAYSELVNCIHDTQLSEEQIVFGVSRKEAIKKCDDAIRQLGNSFLKLYNENRKVEL